MFSQVKSILVVPEGTTPQQLIDGEVLPELRYVPIPTIKSSANTKFFSSRGEINNMPSKTVPNQAMTVRELIVRFASGLPLDAGRVPLYEGDEEQPDIDRMDHIELHEYYKELKDQRNDAINRVKEARTKAEAMKMEKI